jgi:glutamate--cysteine ligase
VIDGCTQALRDLDHVRQVVAEACFPTGPSAPSPGRVGLEMETFPVRVLADGTPIGRVPLDLLAGLLDPEPGSASSTPGCRREPGAAPLFRLDGGGSLNFEPGGQLEHSTAIHSSAEGALAELDLVSRMLAERLRRHGVVLAAAGLDVWFSGGHVPQQLRSPRYPAMAAYFDRRGPYGARMMRRTCSLQVNLDLGAAADLPQRWLVANLAAPLLSATFACSPGPSAVSARALTVQRLDPTRTGFPPGLLNGSGAGPVEQLTQAAMAADLLLLRRADGPWEPGTPGFTFERWLRDGHPRHGRPSEDDLRYHLTTLFLEVRPRGFLELRAIDALPAPLRAAPVVLLAGLLEDPLARSLAAEALERHRRALPELARRAATAGLADPLLRALAAKVWTLALEGAGRLPPAYLDGWRLRQAAKFLDAYTLRGRSPSDALRAALARSPAAALAWASEPVCDPTLRQ